MTDIAAMKRILAPLMLLLGFASNEALACLCAPGEPEQPLQKAAVAFVGQPIKVEVVPRTQPAKTAWQVIRESLSPLLGALPSEHESPPFPKFLDSVRVTFEVSRYLKGRGPDQISIMTGHGGSDCGLPVSISKKYTIYARLIDGSLRTSYCFGSAEFVRHRSAPKCSGS